ncbi:MAG: glutamate-5-semialdehyde dehydrogenase [Candidatus Malihini olakiniferum]
MLEKMGKAAKQASYYLSVLSTIQKNQALSVIANLLDTENVEILAANKLDLADARQDGMSAALQDRLLLTPQRLRAIANDMRQVCRLNDPVGEVIDDRLLDNGLKLERRRIPLGVVGVIYEARPNVTVDVVGLCLKTGNTVILRSGKETYRTNAAMVSVIQRALIQSGLPAAAVQMIKNPDRELVNQLLKLDRYVDILIPRGGARLHKLCREKSTIPVITGGIGVCHIFADESIDFTKALTVIESAKIQRPSACNSLETLLIHRAIAAQFLPALSEKMSKVGVTLHASPEALTTLQSGLANVIAVEVRDYDNEWLSNDLNVALVDDMDAAIAHIREHGTQHSDAILTRSASNAERFVREVDSSVVYVNASTRFTDGGQFGLGAEVAVSTQKLHVRGPMGLEALTTYKWIGHGEDLIRV